MTKTKNLKKICILAGCMTLACNPKYIKAEEVIQIEVTDKEKEVLEYFLNVERNVYELLTQKGVKAKEKLTNIMYDFVLFMKDEKPIHGLYYSDLKEETKTKIDTIFILVDTSISNKYPNYQENIKIKGKSGVEHMVGIYNNILEKMKNTKKEDVEEKAKKAKEKVSDVVDTYVDDDLQQTVMESVKDGVDDMKSSVTFWKEKIFKK